MSSASVLSVLAGAVALAAAATLAACSGAEPASQSASTPSDSKESLTAIGFTIDTQKGPLVGANVLPYEVKNPLFSDNAFKARVIRLPAGTAARYTAQGAFEFPVGTVAAKSFGYPDAAGKVRWIETRVLVREASGWQGYEYRWNDEQTNAFRSDESSTLALDGLHGGAPATYTLPTESDCAGCHGTTSMAPIGLHAAQLNVGDQLAAWANARALGGLPAASEIPSVPRWNDPTTSERDAARAYLDANCAHCHRDGGSASGTGLFLGWSIADTKLLGTCKAPVSHFDGRLDIVPGRPEDSFLVARIRATDDERMRMPPVGRTLMHASAVSIIEGWIREMPGSCHAP